jgi:hypothetical protein
MTNPNTHNPKRPSGVRRVVTIAVAGATLGVCGAFAVAQDDQNPIACAPTAADLRRAADAARLLEAQRPDLFEQSPRRADYDDLRLAAEWSSRMSVLDPDGQPAHCTR